MSSKAKNALVYPKISNESLLSIGQLCDDGCVAVFTNESVLISKDNKLILEGTRNKVDGLWDVPVKNDNFRGRDLQVNYIIQRKKSKHDLAHYLHGCAMSPKVSTFQAAIDRGNFVTWPGIDNLNFRDIIRTTEATEKGHMNQEQQGLQSTKEIIKDEEDAFPDLLSCSPLWVASLLGRRKETFHGNVKVRSSSGH